VDVRLTWYFRELLLFAWLADEVVEPAAAQIPLTEPVKIRDEVIFGSLPTRIESWDWFAGNGNQDYTFPGSILASA
jgi:hypothetical protein